MISNNNEQQIYKKSKENENKYEVVNETIETRQKPIIVLIS